MPGSMKTIPKAQKTKTRLFVWFCGNKTKSQKDKNSAFCMVAVETKQTAKKDTNSSFCFGFEGFGMARRVSDFLSFCVVGEVFVWSTRFLSGRRVFIWSRDFLSGLDFLSG